MKNRRTDRLEDYEEDIECYSKKYKREHDERENEEVEDEEHLLQIENSDFVKLKGKIFIKILCKIKIKVIVYLIIINSF